jgi:uncharacterized paraquat-inducible protein A
MLPELAPGASARCPRCYRELWRHREDSLNRTFALTLGAALLYVVANSVPMLGLTIVGREASTTVIGGAEHLWQNALRTDSRFRSCMNVLVHVFASSDSMLSRYMC